MAPHDELAFAGGDQSWPDRASIGQERAVWIRRSSAVPLEATVTVTEPQQCEQPGETVFVVDGSASTGAARWEWTSSGFSGSTSFDDPAAPVTSFRVSSIGVDQSGTVTLTVHDASDTLTDSDSVNLDVWAGGDLTSEGNMLRAIRQAADTVLAWAPRGDGGYAVYRTPDKRQLTDLPAVLTPLATPAMPAYTDTDTEAGDLFYYRVYGGCV